jgi:hypothetical protein
MSKAVRCASGIRGWQDRLRNVYANLDEFTIFAETYGIHTRLGFASPQEAWDANPTIQGSTDPDDLRVVTEPDQPREAVLRGIPATGRQVATMAISGPALGGIESDADREHLLGTVGELAAGFQCELGQLGFDGVEAVVPADIVGESWLAAGLQHGRGQPPPVESQPSPPSEGVNPP